MTVGRQRDHSVGVRGSVWETASRSQHGRGVATMVAVRPRCYPRTSGHMLSVRRRVMSNAVGEIALGALKQLGGVAGFLAKAYGILLLAVFVLQRKLIFIPPAVPVDPTLQDRGARLIRLAPNSGSGPHVAVLFRPREASGPVLVYFHGNADQLGWGAAQLGMRFGARHGLGLYGVEYPGYGLAQPGSPTEATIYEAAEALLQHLLEDIAVPRSRVVLLGQSLGCAVAVEMARRGFGSRLVLLSPFTSMPEVACAVYPFLAPALQVVPFLVRDSFDNRKKAADLRIPTLVVHGKDDEIVPFSMGRELHELILDAAFLPVPDVGHNDLLESEEVLREVALFSRLAADKDFRAA